MSLCLLLDARVLVSTGCKIDTSTYASAVRLISTESSAEGHYFARGQPFLQYFQLNMSAPNQLYFTYSVEWKESAVTWASRWDIYARKSDVRRRWFGITCSLVVVIFLSGMICKYAYMQVRCP